MDRVRLLSNAFQKIGTSLLCHKCEMCKLFSHVLQAINECGFEFQVQVSSQNSSPRLSTLFKDI